MAESKKHSSYLKVNARMQYTVKQQMLIKRKEKLLKHSQVSSATQSQGSREEAYRQRNQSQGLREEAYRQRIGHKG